jgi:ubiquinone/menaquinone biosynthesis C-methylase UbiE
VGFYRKFVVPRLINLAMSNKDTARVRSQIIPAARGRVLEVGIGSGLNLPFYSSEVRELQGVDPSKELLQMAGEKAGATPFPVELVSGSAEELPLQDQTIDTIVMTWSLCSIPDPSKALDEMRRVLKPGGELIFVEHGLAPEPKVSAWQNRINRPWRAIAGGCNLNRPVDRLIAAAGFSLLQLDTTYMPGPKIFTFTYKGCARKQ